MERQRGRGREGKVQRRRERGISRVPKRGRKKRRETDIVRETQRDGETERDRKRVLERERGEGDERERENENNSGCYYLNRRSVLSFSKASFSSNLAFEWI